MKKARKARVATWFSLPPYPAGVAFVVGKSVNEAIAYYRRVFRVSGDLSIHDCKGVTLTADNNAHLIFMPCWENDVDCFSVLSHESVHVANRVLQQIGCKQFGWDNDEPLAYLQSYVFENCLKRVLPKKKAKK